MTLAREPDNCIERLSEVASAKQYDSPSCGGNCCGAPVAKTGGPTPLRPKSTLSGNPGLRSGRRNWAGSAPTKVASGRTGVRAKPVVHLRVRSTLHRPKQKHASCVPRCLGRILRSRRPRFASFLGQPALHEPSSTERAQFRQALRALNRTVEFDGILARQW
jgi:hypothetical protein